MNDRCTDFTDYDAWLAACRAAGLDGPYEVWSTPPCQQFVRADFRAGTVAVWNYGKNKGYLLHD